MDKVISHKIVCETLENSFNKEKFVYFIKNLLNSFNEASFVYRGNFIPDAYEKHISTLERIGKYSDGECKIDILIVNLKKKTSIERARTMQRNFIAWYLNGSRGGELKDAALVAFVSPNEKDWRFSLVKMDYRFEERENGKVKVKEEFTPARRWSFLVGENEKSHTAQSRLVPIIADDEHNPTLKQLEEAFNIEKVTKEFFEKYRELFLRVHETLNDVIKHNPNIKSDFAEKNVSTVDFSKKLLGQIVFLYFLQKKGWFGVKRNEKWGSGSKRFLRDLFDKKVVDYKIFFNDILEPLFYDALSRDRSDIDHWNDHFQCKIPFLNGGLFDPISGYSWEKTDINLPNNLFSNEIKDIKTGDIGNGILNIFDRYNFTVKEDEPLEKEVAVDPEMLGKVFENLLEVKDRKSKGTYYTPREIVHYMCEQSLVNYLATDLDGKVSKEDLDKLIKSGESVAEYEATYVAKKENNPNYDGRYGQAILPKSIEKFAEDIDESLADIKICDPAIGSGAFPVGMMNEIVKSRAVLSIYIKNPRRTIYGFKRDCIQNSLYGVDIDSGAVEIAKLRLWLSLVVDEDDINQIKPLPNLDYKIMQGNSLLEEFENVKLFDEKLITTVDVGKEKQIELLKQKQTVLQKQYFELHSENKLTPAKQAELNSGLKKLQTQINKLSQTETVETEKSGLFDVYSEAKKKAEELKRLHKEFFDATQKSKKDDIKKHIERLGWDLIEATLKEQNKISQLKKIEEFKKSNTKPFFLWRLNFADVFEDKGGFDVVIANPPYVSYYSRESAKTANTTKELSILREKFDFTKYERKTGRLNLWMFFAEKFVKLLRINGVSSFIVDVNFTKDLAKNIRKYLLENMSIKQFIHDLSEFEYVASGQVILIAQKDNDVSCNKILIKSSLLGPGMQIQQSGISEPDYSFFVLTTDTIISKLSKETKLGELKQLQLTTGVQIGGIEIYKGKPIKDYFYKTDWDYKNVFPAVDPTSVRRYSKSKFERGIVFDYELASKITEATEKSAVVLRKYKDFLDNEKILIRQSASEILATIAAPKTCGEYSLFSLISNDKNFSIKYLLALFNSKIYTYFAVKSGIVLMKKGTQPQIRKSGLEKLPIKRISLSSQQPFIDLVDKILTITKGDYKSFGTKLQRF